MLKFSGAKAKERVNYTKERYTPSYIEKVPQSERLFPYFDERLVITVHGEPIADSRPRFMKERDGTYNPHKAFLMRVFKSVYEQDELLQRTLIERPLGMRIKSFVTPEKKISKAIGVDIIDEKSLSIKQKDNDNIEKVHWDVMQDEKYSVILDDRLVAFNETIQMYSIDPRIILEIHYPSDEMLKMQSKYFKPYIEHIERLATYRKARIYPKYIFTISNTKIAKFPEVFFNNISKCELTGKQVENILHLYKAEEIKLLMEYLKAKPLTRDKNVAYIKEAVVKGTYPITVKKKNLRRLK